MIFYRAILTSPVESGAIDWSHHGTRDEAHTAAKGYPKVNWPNVRVEQIDVATDKTGILSLLMGYDVSDQEPVTANWGLTPRGGLRELPKGE